MRFTRLPAYLSLWSSWGEGLTLVNFSSCLWLAITFQEGRSLGLGHPESTIKRWEQGTAGWGPHLHRLSVSLTSVPKMAQEPGPETSVAKISRANWKGKVVGQAPAPHPVYRKKYVFHYLSICVRLEIIEAVDLIWLNHWTVLFPERICDGFTRLGVGRKRKLEWVPSCHL